MAAGCIAIFEVEFGLEYTPGLAPSVCAGVGGTVVYPVGDYSLALAAGGTASESPYVCFNGSAISGPYGIAIPPSCGEQLVTQAAYDLASAPPPADGMDWSSPALVLQVVLAAMVVFIFVMGYRAGDKA